MQTLMSKLQLTTAVVLASVCALARCDKRKRCTILQTPSVTDAAICWQDRIIQYAW